MSIQYQHGVPFFDFVSEGKDYRAILKKGESSEGWLLKFQKYLYATKGKVNPFATPQWNNEYKQHMDVVPYADLKKYWDDRYRELTARKESSMPNPASYPNTEKGYKKYMGDSMHQTLHMERKDRDHAVAISLNRWRAEHGSKHPGKPKKRSASSFVREIAKACALLS